MRGCLHPPALALQSLPSLLTCLLTSDPEAYCSPVCYKESLKSHVLISSSTCLVCFQPLLPSWAFLTSLCEWGHASIASLQGLHLSFLSQYFSLLFLQEKCCPSSSCSLPFLALTWTYLSVLKLLKHSILYPPLWSLPHLPLVALLYL